MQARVPKLDDGLMAEPALVHQESIDLGEKSLLVTMQRGRRTLFNRGWAEQLLTTQALCSWPPASFAAWMTFWVMILLCGVVMRASSISHGTHSWTR